MAKILFLAHRAPFPADKGDKIRALHMLQRLAERHEVWLGAAVDEPGDPQSQAQGLCREACLPRLGRMRRWANMFWGLLAGQPLSVARFHHPRLAAWVRKVLRDVEPDVVIAFSSAPAQFLIGRMRPGIRLIVDFVDADAEKWRAYAEIAAWPMRWVYAAEFRRLVRFDAAALQAAESGILISETERRLLADLLPQGAAKLRVMPNGVDTDYFRPLAATLGAKAEIVLCGRMDYLPNIDAAVWFAQEVFPLVRARCPQAVFRVVGAAPSGRVMALAAEPGIEVTGAVPDVRPYVGGATVVVAPLRIARGIQNKVLEAMACGRPVVATPQALDGIAAEPGRDVLVAQTPKDFAAAVCSVLLGRAPSALGQRARDFVLRRHQWPVELERLEQLVEGEAGPRSAQTAA